MPLHLYRTIFTQFDPLMPELKRHIRRTNIDLDHEVDAVVLFACVPPVAVLQLEGGEGEEREVGVDAADGVACFWRLLASEKGEVKERGVAYKRS